MTLETLDMPSTQCSPAAERNLQPILQTLQALLPATGRALEVASGTGQHVAGFAAALPGWTWQPSDHGVANLESIAAWTAQTGLRNVLAPVPLDVRAARWPGEAPAENPAPWDLVYCANLLHIAPWDCCAGLVQGAARTLAPHGLLVTYGPYLEDGVPTAPGNLAFDASLRERNPAWGLRRLEDVADQAAQAGLVLGARHRLPANNLLLVFTRRPPHTTPAQTPATAL